MNFRQVCLSAALAAAQLAISGHGFAANDCPPANDYPTADRADYVLGCMAANNNTRIALLKCSCSIDAIAKAMPYAEYEKAQTALAMQAGGGLGGRVGEFRDPPELKRVIEKLHRAQADADLQCF